MRESWFDICGVRMKFSLDKFALISGLNCVHDSNNIGVHCDDNFLIEKYFAGTLQPYPRP